MRKYTLSGLINTLRNFEAALERKLRDAGYTEKADMARERRAKIEETWNMVIVEMTLEPIYTVDPMNILEEMEKNGFKDVERYIRDMYLKLAGDVGEVSGEFGALFQSFSRL